MKDIIDELDHSVTSDINLYGTCNFERVWENICQNVLGHQNEWINEIKKPIWRKIGETEGTEASTLLPDLTILEDNTFYILDAKYYNCDFDEKGRLTGSNPEVQDVSKQFLYQVAFEDYFKNNIEQKFYNGFLFPGENTDKEYEVIGEVVFPFTIFEGKKIELIKINTTKIYEMYLNNEVNLFIR